MSEHRTKFGKSFDDVSSVRTYLLDAAFFKGFCNTLAPVSTTYTGKKCVENLLPPQKLSVKRQQDKESRVPFNYFGGNIPIYFYENGCNESYISIHISAWGAKRNMSCGVLLINFATQESYNDYLNGKSEEYDHLESKCFQVGTHTPLFSSATFHLNKTGMYRQAAKIVDGNITVHANVSASLFLNTTIPTTKNITETEYCKYAKQTLCSHGLAGRSAVLRYFSLQPLKIDNISVCHAMCKLVLPQNTLFQIITRTFIYKHTGGRAKHSNAQTQRSIILQQSQYISSQVQSQSHTPQYRNRTRQVSTTLLHTPSFGEARPER